MPIVCLCFGYFPVALNFWTVLAITVYYTIFTVLAFYCTKWSHFKSRWMAHWSSTILFWPYLKASLITPWKSLSNAAVEPKATARGRTGGSAGGLKNIGPAILLIALNTVAFIAGIIAMNFTVNAPRTVSLCWYDSSVHVARRSANPAVRTALDARDQDRLRVTHCQMQLNAGFGARSSGITF